MIRWRRRKIDSSAEKNLVAGMILSNDFIKGIIPILRVSLLKSPSAKIISGWCVEYYRKYNRAPGLAVIQDILQTRGGVDENQEDSINEFLSVLENETVNNVPYLLDKSEHYLKTLALEELKKGLSKTIAEGSPEKGEALIASFKRVERPQSVGIDILRDKEAIVSAIDKYQEEVLFQLSGDLGRVIGPFCRGDLVAVAGPAKRGKTWWLEEIAVKALRERLKVIFFSLEMTEKQMMRRIYQNFLGEVRSVREGEEYKVVQIPYFDEDKEIQFRTAQKKGLKSSMAVRKSESMSRGFGGGKFLLVNYPANSIGVSGLDIHLDNLEYYDNFIPDVIMVDYADILQPEIKGEVRHQINDTWLKLRQMAQERKCVVVTATHLNKATFSRDAEAGDASEDSRKSNHVASMFAINQDREDIKNSSVRIKVLVSRHEAISDEVLVLHQLDIGKPCIDSRIIFHGKKEKKNDNSNKGI